MKLFIVLLFLSACERVVHVVADHRSVDVKVDADEYKHVRIDIHGMAPVPVIEIPVPVPYERKPVFAEQPAP